MSTCSSIGKVDSPITVGPVVRVGGAAFWVAANPGDVGDRRVVDAVSEYVRAMNIARGAMRCKRSLHRGDG